MTAVPCRRVDLVVWPGDATLRELVGGKAFHLQALTRCGIPVPRWFVLTTAATDAILAPVQEEIAALAACVERGDVREGCTTVERIAEFARTATWPTVVGAAFRSAVEMLGGERGFAVRSSAVCEDGPADSYAGVFESRLGVPLNGLETSVRECLAAAFAEQVAQYRRERGLSGAWPRLAILVQEMGEARVAGVAFTADPLSGEPRHIVVAGYGLGSGVVGDLVETDCFERAPGCERWTSTVRCKTREVVPDGTGGTVLRSVAPADWERPALSTEQLDRLSRMLVQIEQVFAGPQDVEWALDTHGALRILQSRPISTVPGEQAVWDDSNIGESYPGITLPLTYSLVRRTYERLFTRALAEIGVPQRVLASLRPELQHLIGIVRGHLYMNLLAYYHLFAAAPGIGWMVSKWEDALGVRDAPDSTTVPSAVGRSWMRRTALAALVWWRLVQRLRAIDAEVERFRDGVDEMLARFDGVDLARWPFDRLLASFNSLERDHLDDWTILIFNDLFAFLFNDRLARLCGPSSDGERSDLHQHLLADLGGAAILRPLVELCVLAAEARSVPAVERLVWSDLPTRKTWERLVHLPAAADFRATASAYLKHFGDRTVEELKLETVTPSEEPCTIVDLLRSVAERHEQPPNGAGGERELRAAAEREFRARRAGRPLGRWYAAMVLGRTRRLVAAREQMSFARARAYGLLRRLARAMGTALVREGVLAEPEDIHYVTFEDLEGHARGGLPGVRLDALVAVRKEAYRGYHAAQPPHRIVCRGSVYRAAAAAALQPAVPASEDALAGIPCSPGWVCGVACVVDGGVSLEAVRDRILVARVTEPGWVFLMSVARGVVVERGSLLSHAAIIGRELGVPTIVGATGATTAIRSGDEVEMNGSTGDVRILRRQGSPLHSP